MYIELWENKEEFEKGGFSRLGTEFDIEAYGFSWPIVKFNSGPSKRFIKTASNKNLFLKTYFVSQWVFDSLKK